MATKQELQEQLDTVLELNAVQAKDLATARDLISELNRQIAQLHRELDMTKKLSENASVQSDDSDLLPWEDAPTVYTRKPAVSSYKARCAAAKAEAMASGRVTRI